MKQVVPPHPDFPVISHSPHGNPSFTLDSLHIDMLADCILPLQVNALVFDCVLHIGKHT